ncbi:MAG: bifunctional folylpolyglutamate synthase/dihydrofolate synthase [Armatimonadetes bacterium CG07_land_8_20_14_0_80_40_9]|nr:MAG: bifunctional folylpolyglutamate synthase/dihydrofolate synthase [Armatimonadetes bacterium CG07_land_8_20_14_0_80_40_9]
MTLFNYKQAIFYLDSFTDYEKIRDYHYDSSYFNLNRVRYLLSLLGNPQQGLKYIHIAGTKGKGSTAVMVTYSLAAEGYKVGLFTSPHLKDFRERIKVISKKQKSKEIKEELISEREVCGLVAKIRPGVNKMQSFADSHPQPTTFELYTALAFLFFAQMKVDFVVLEVGLGGRLDATNVVEPLVCAITSLSLDHTQELGNNLRDIAKEKAGIIKKGSLVMSSPQKDEALKVIKKVCKEREARMSLVGRDLRVGAPLRTKRKSPLIPLKKGGQSFEVRGIFQDYKDLFIPLLGRHQLINAAVAIGILELLRFHNIIISQEAIKEGLSKIIWPGRLQIIKKKPLIVLDGAHNVESAKALKEAIRENFSYKDLFLILSIFKDKDVAGIIRQLSPLSSKIILTSAKSGRSAKPEDIAKIIKSKEKIIITKDIKEALGYALSKASPKDLICITGSFHLVGEALLLLQEIPYNPNCFVSTHSMPKSDQKSRASLLRT